MDKQKMIASIKQSFMLKRFRAEEECDEFITSLRKNPEFDSLYSEYNEKNLKYIKSKYEREDECLKSEVEFLKSKISKFLTENNIDRSRLYPKYDCKICQDTGVHNGMICDCLAQALSQKMSLKSSSQTEFKSFDDCIESKMEAEDIKARDWLKLWCSRYPNVTKCNVNILGLTGCGKTFLLECVANELLNKGAVICYKTAFELNESARLYHIGKSYELIDCIKADVLIIDDLGTEPILKNVTKEYLYNLINQRQIHNRPTFISSNLSLDNILSRYDERIFSRLANKNLSITIELRSADKRIK